MLYNKTHDELLEIASKWGNGGERELAGFGRSKLLRLITGPDGPSLLRLYDNNSDLHHCFCNGLEILPPSLIDGKRERVIVFIRHPHASVRRQLEEYGLKEYEDFISSSDYCLLRNWFEYRRLVLQTLIITPTLKCSLQCAGCSMHVPLVRRAGRATIRPLQEMKDEVDLLMRFVDQIQALALVGGEIFLHGDFAKLLDYIHDAYYGRILSLETISNATIIPDDETMAALKKASVTVKISDYSKALGQSYQENLNIIVGRFKDYGIEHYLLRAAAWIEMYGDDPSEILYNPGEVEDHYGRCLSVGQCPGFSNGRLYPCNMAWAAEVGGWAPPDSVSGLDFSRLNPDSDEDRFRILRTFLGHLPASSTPWLCARCRGWWDSRDFHIPVARQLRQMDGKA